MNSRPGTGRATVVVALATMIAAGAGSRLATAESPAKPNVLIFYADEYRFDCLGAAGNTEIQTPNLDALAADGVLYENSFCVWPVCTPSRYSLLSGLYAHQHRGYSNRSTLLPHLDTFPRLLRDAGYRTSAVGKMHFTPAYLDVGFSRMTLAEQNGLGRNVDDYHRHLKSLGLINALDLIDQERRYRPRAPESYWETFGAHVSDLPDEHHITTWVADRAVEEVAEWTAGGNGLLMVGFLKPHHPFDPPAPWHELYDPEELSLPPGWTDSVPPVDAARNRGYFDNERLTPEAMRRVTAFYYATITHMDHHIGRVIGELRRKGLYDNTLIVFTADHGEYLGFHHLLLKANHMYDPLIKVPLIIKYPAGRHAGERSADLTDTLDVTATVLREAGVKLPGAMQGLPLGAATPGRSEPRDHVFAHDGAQFMVRSRTRKLLRGARAGAGDLLFDLDRDPHELKPVHADPDYAADLAALETALLDWALGTARLPSLVDTEAPQIGGENVPGDIPATERDMQEYFDRGVEPLLKPAEEARNTR